MCILRNPPEDAGALQSCLGPVYAVKMEKAALAFLATGTGVEQRSSANGMWPLSTVDEAESLQEKQGHFKAIKLLAGTLARAQEAAQPTAMHI
ncbi:Adhesion G-Protein Coupled Receptor D1 [Manis pentadactyla]|nr:Adhesion G-Protein Coupled Receptor D1 [Manis pentadactyla]